jgi:hypothetical protein
VTRHAIGPLGTAERSALDLLAELPLLWTEGLARMLGLASRTAGFELVADLRRGGLVGAADLPVRPGRAPLLLYPTDRGVAALAAAHGEDAAAFARRLRLRDADLRALVPGLPYRLACYELLLAVAATHAGRPELVAWECPWRRTVRRPGSGAELTVRLPAGVALRWPDRHGSYVLLPDTGAVALRAYRDALVGLVLGRRAGCPTPLLVVGAPDEGRASGWRTLADRVRVETGCELPLLVVTPGGLPVAADDGTLRGRRRGPGQLGLPAPAPAGRAVGDPFRVTGRPVLASDRPGRLALALAPCDRRLLDVIGPHSFLPVKRLAVVVGWGVKWTRERRDHLIRLGLARLLGPQRVAGRRMPELGELTRDGAAIAAAQLGLTPGQAARFLGLVGHSPARARRHRKRGARRLLLKHLRHTVAVDALFVHLHAVACRRAAAGGDDALLEWRNAAACARGHLRPDGYGLYRQTGQLYGFLLEYDGGTEGPAQLRRKFERYYRYRDGAPDGPRRRESGPPFERDFAVFPTVLVVATDYGAENRVAAALAALAVGRAPLPVLVTTRDRIGRDPNGMLGPVWRGPHDTRRRPWLAGPGRGNVARLGGAPGDTSDTRRVC